MDILRIKELLNKFRQRECTEGELKGIWDLVTDDAKEKIIKDILLEDLSGFSVKGSENKTVNFDRIFNKITATINRLEHEKRLKRQVINWKNLTFMQLARIAAIFILLFAGGGCVSYILLNEKGNDIISYNEVKAPLGARSELLLPDGSQVWLNAGSKLRYNNVFNTENRTVTLEGEAYFKVAKNKKIPFRVKTGDLNIVALGTEFNVKSYDDEGIIETTLVEGRVSIRHNRQKNSRSQMIYLKPRQKAVYVKEYQRLRVEDINTIRKSIPDVPEPKRGIVYVEAEVDPVPIISWKDDRLIFKGEELSNLIVKLERKYNVSFSFESENIKQFRFTGTLEDETLTQVLDGIKLSAPIDYMLEGKKVMIFENKQMMKKFSNHLKKK